MAVRLEQTVGDMKVVIEGADTKEVIKDVTFWAELPKECPKCGAGVHLFHRERKNFNFYGLQCFGNQKHETNFGQYKVGGGLFYKGPSSWTNAMIGGQMDEEESGYTREDPLSRSAQQARPSQPAPQRTAATAASGRPAPGAPSRPVQSAAPRTDAPAPDDESVNDVDDPFRSSAMVPPPARRTPAAVR